MIFFLQVGDYALVQVVNLDQASECYVPSIVQFTPQKRQAQAQYYTVMLYNGQRVSSPLKCGKYHLQVPPANLPKTNLVYF